MIEQTTLDFTSTQMTHFSPKPHFFPISLQMTVTGAEIQRRNRKFMSYKWGKVFTISGSQDLDNKCMYLHSQYNVWRQAV